MDWRFLLPDPRLGRVAHRTADDQLVQACRLFGSSATQLPMPGEPAAAQAFDVVVLEQPSAAVLAAGIERLAPGGWLYVEVHGLLARRRRPTGPRRLAPAYARELAARGLVEVSITWHWPGFSPCDELIPLGDRAGVRSALRRRRTGRRLPLRLLAGALLLRSGLLPFVVPAASVIGRRAAAGGSA